jgi:hypothetical protein
LLLLPFIRFAIELFAGFPDNFSRHLCHIPEQYLPAIFRRKKSFAISFILKNIRYDGIIRKFKEKNFFITT